jgi:uncharacterized membrane protein
VSGSARWAICWVLAILGVLALIAALIYVSVPIHSLPGFLPGNRPVGGHYHKRALLVGVIGVVLLVIAAFVGMSARRSSTAQIGSPSGSSAGSTPGGATAH